MQIKVPLTDGYLPDKYGKHADAADYYQGNPAVSFPIEISDTPQGTKSLALVFIDHDAIPVCGFTWIHWTAINLDPSTTLIPEDASRSGKVAMVQGKNSNAGGLINNQDVATTQHYTGPTPPDKTHEYTLTVYALDTVLPLQTGFWLNDFYHAAEPHLLATTSLEIKSES